MAVTWPSEVALIAGMCAVATQPYPIMPTLYLFMEIQNIVSCLADLRNATYFGRDCQSKRKKSVFIWAYPWLNFTHENRSHSHRHESPPSPIRRRGRENNFRDDGGYSF